MTLSLDALKERLNGIAWREQVESELRERGPVSRPADAGIEAELRELASGVDTATLDALEQEEGYLVWALRLAPFVDGPRARERARRHRDSPNWHVRHWARSIP